GMGGSGGGEAVGGHMWEVGVVVASVQAIHRQELADRDGDRAGLGGHTEELALEAGVAPDLRLCHKTIDRVVELARDRGGIGALEGSLGYDGRRRLARYR